MLVLSLCHTVLAEKNKNSEIEYQASSPDEVALVNAARDIGFTFLVSNLI